SVHGDEVRRCGRARRLAGGQGVVERVAVDHDCGDAAGVQVAQQIREGNPGGLDAAVAAELKDRDDEEEEDRGGENRCRPARPLASKHESSSSGSAGCERSRTATRESTLERSTTSCVSGTSTRGTRKCFKILTYVSAAQVQEMNESFESASSAGY